MKLVPFPQLADFWQSLPVSLLHTLWQGALMALLLWLVLRGSTGERPGLRYALCMGALFGLVFAWLVTWCILSYPPPPTPSAMPAEAAAPAMPPPEAIPPTQAPTEDGFRGMAPAPLPNPPAPWQSWLATVWLCGVLLMAVRAAMLLRGAGAMRRRAVPCEEPHVLELLAELQAAMRMPRRVAMLVSDRIAGPVVMGVLAPAILLPMAMLSGLPPAHLRAILAHELAHIRRYDYLVNLAQLLVESLLFFNPAVWWLSRQVRLEREACCDAVAVRHCESPVRYAALLAQHAAEASGAVLAFGQPAEEGTLLQRVRRILLPQDRPALRLPWYSLASLLLLGVALLAGIGGGAWLTVSAVAAAMNPHERVARIAAIQEQHGALEYPDVRVRVTGTVRTHDGSPLPESLHLIGRSNRVTGVNYTFSEGYSEEVQDGHFSLPMQAGVGHVYVQAAGYAIAISGPFEVLPEFEPIVLDLMLEPGFTGLLQLASPAGEPVVDAEVTWSYPLRTVEQRGGTNYQDGLSPDAQGIVRLPHQPHWPLDLRILAPGFERLELRDVLLVPEEVYEVVLTPAHPVVLHVRDQETGQPVAGAKLYLLSMSGGANASHRFADPLGLRRPEVVAESDAQGRLVFDTLINGAHYDCIVEGPSGAKQRVQLHAGQARGEVLLGPPLTVSGTVHSTPGEESVRLGYNFTYRSMNGGSVGYGYSLEVPLENGNGAFTTPGLFPGELRFDTTDSPVHLHVKEKPIEGVVVHLDAAPQHAEHAPRREIQLVFNAPPGAPAPAGTARLHYRPIQNAVPLEPETLRIEEGHAVFEAPVPRNILVTQIEVMGYWVEEVRAEVPEGDGPFILEVDALPAGAIHGAVQSEAPGTVHVSVSEVHRHEPGSRRTPSRSARVAEDGTYVCTPLPLDGVYVLVASNGAAAVVSPEIRLTEAQPIREHALHLPAGLPISGRLLLPDGQPAAGQRLRLWREADGLASSTVDAYTGADGGFRFEHVNPNAPFRYAIDVAPPHTHQQLREAVRPGQTVTLRLQPGFVLEGEVIDEQTGDPVPDVVVYATSTQPELSTGETRTGADGRFRLSTLRNQEHMLGVRSGSLSSPTYATPGNRDVQIRIRQDQTR